ncbi:hypothetical protein PMW00_05685 [Clostridium paraputrificum]|uniref:3'-5' exonuclease n=1 Tax=Clostridium paraputrificum TaxID=29363 RepID=UPI002330E0A7|nr:BRCT domain-containing protein [Clostridium paraputrificum]MDB2102511.1 hypothetical protein [Clostridium paraputrificum]
MISPKRAWKEFDSFEEKLEKLKEFEIISPKAKEIKTLYYKGAYTTDIVECDVVGYVDKFEIILNINGELHSIMPECFVEMQKRERFIIVDIETPKSFKPKDGIREVAAVFVEDYRVVDSIHIAKITDEDLYKKGYGQGLQGIEEDKESIERFKAFISKYKCPIIAHNAQFERSFLRYWKWVDEKQKFYCSMHNIKLKEDLESYKLISLLKHFRIKSEQTHTAMEDVLDLLELLKVVKIEKWVELGASSIKEAPDKDTDKKVNTKIKYLSKEEKENNKRRLEEAKNNIIKDIFNGKKLVFTGDMTKERNEMMELAIKYGATAATSVSGKTGLVVLGEAPGKSKVSKAEQLGIKMISEKEFFEIIEREEIV